MTATLAQWQRFINLDQDSIAVRNYAMPEGWIDIPQRVATYWTNEDFSSEWLGDAHYELAVRALVLEAFGQRMVGQSSLITANAFQARYIRAFCPWIARRYQIEGQTAHMYGRVFEICWHRHSEFREWFWFIFRTCTDDFTPAVTAMEHGYCWRLLFTEHKEGRPFMSGLVLSVMSRYSRLSDKRFYLMSTGPSRWHIAEAQNGLTASQVLEQIGDLGELGGLKSNKNVQRSKGSLGRVVAPRRGNVQNTTIPCNSKRSSAKVAKTEFIAGKMTRQWQAFVPRKDLNKIYNKMKLSWKLVWEAPVETANCATPNRSSVAATSRVFIPRGGGVTICSKVWCGVSTPHPQHKSWITGSLAVCACPGSQPGGEVAPVHPVSKVELLPFEADLQREPVVNLPQNVKKGVEHLRASVRTEANADLLIRGWGGAGTCQPTAGLARLIHISKPMKVMVQYRAGRMGQMERFVDLEQLDQLLDWLGNPVKRKNAFNFPLCENECGRIAHIMWQYNGDADADEDDLPLIVLANGRWFVYRCAYCGKPSDEFVFLKRVEYLHRDRLNYSWPVLVAIEAKRLQEWNVLLPELLATKKMLWLSHQRTVRTSSSSTVPIEQYQEGSGSLPEKPRVPLNV